MNNAGVAAKGMELLAHRDKPAGWSNPANPGDFGFVNSDLAFQGDYAFVGGFNGIQIWNIANPSAPTLQTALLCPGGQGDAGGDVPDGEFDRLLGRQGRGAVVGGADAEGDRLPVPVARGPGHPPESQGWWPHAGPSGGKQNCFG